MISKPRFWKKHNELHIVTLKNHDPDILDHLFQKMCYQDLGGYITFNIYHKTINTYTKLQLTWELLLSNPLNQGLHSCIKS